MAYQKATKAQIELFLKLTVERGLLPESEVEVQRSKLSFRSYSDIDRAIRRVNSTQKFDRQKSPASEKQLSFIADLEKAVGDYGATKDISWMQADLRIKRLLQMKREALLPTAPVIDMFTRRRVS